MSASIRRTVVCTGKKDEKDRSICGGGGWWGEEVPDNCPRCGSRTLPRGETYVIPLTKELS